MNKLIINLKSLNIEPIILAKFFYERGITSHLFVQKLIYFSYLEGLKNELLIFQEKFQAWKHGPVLVSIFAKMTGCSDLDTMFDEVPNLQQKEVITILEKICQKYRDCDVWDLVDKSHEGPWAKARVGLSEEDISTNELVLKDLFAFANAQE